MTAAARRRSKIQKKYRWLHEELRAKRGLSFNHGNSTVPGCRVIEATFIETPFPIGFIWYRHVGVGTIEILAIFVIDYFRRCGVATFLLQKLIAAFPGTKAVQTGDGTEFGKPWLIANGFIFADGLWQKRIGPAPKCRK